MADDITIIEGLVKFREGKKWKPRWCVLRKLSPVADCIQLELYREGARRGAALAALALRGAAALEAGFTLDRQSHTLAVLGAELAVLLALPGPEALLQWQVKVEAVLGPGRQFPVAVPEGSPVPAGPARLHLRPACAALVAGSPPVLLRHWPLQHLRRFGAVDGRLVLEGGALSGAAGALALLAPRPERLERELRAAARALAAAPRELDSPKSHWFPRPDTRRPDVGSLPRSLTAGDALLAGRSSAGEPWAAAGEPAWPDDEPGCGGRAAGAGLQRCVSCMSALGVLAGPPAAGRPLLPPPRPFRPAWSMHTPVTAPPRPPATLDAAGLAALLGPAPARLPGCPADAASRSYDNYDVPRPLAREVPGELAREPCACAGPLYALVDPRRKARARAEAGAGAGAEAGARRQYENAAFAASLPHYENASDVLRRAPAANYLVMCPAAGAGYARMSPRAASSPALAAAPATARRRAASVHSPTGSRESLSSTDTLCEAPAGAAPSETARRRLPVAGGNRDSSSSNDSGVSSCARRPAPGGRRRARSSEPAYAGSPARAHKSRSAEAAVPLLRVRAPRGAGDAHSTSSGASDLSDYMETLSLCSSHSSTDTPDTTRSHAAGAGAGAGLRAGAGAGGARECAAVLRPRSGAEYRRLLPAPRPAR